MSSVLTKGTDDENATEFVHVACTYACVASENPALENSLKTNYYIIVSVLHLFLHGNGRRQRLLFPRAYIALKSKPAGSVLGLAVSNLRDR